jgi:hypothetical protein
MGCTNALQYTIVIVYLLFKEYRQQPGKYKKQKKIDKSSGSFDTNFLTFIKEKEC